MIIMGTHGTIWFHRYCTHKSFTFRHGIWRFITQNLVIKTIPEEVYVVSHHVHHAKAMSRVTHIMPVQGSYIVFLLK
jgi:stearoyl-CoA desaturase (delta-9 desaturase)